MLQFVRALPVERRQSISALLGFYDTGSLAEFRGTVFHARGVPLLLSFLVLGVLPGCVEEVFFRGFAQTRLVQRWGRAVGVTVTSVLFGLMHMDAVHTVLAAGIGLWLGYASERAGSIRPCIFAHATNNVAATALTALGLSSPTFAFNAVASGISAAVVALCAWQLVHDSVPAAGPETVASERA